MIKKHSVEQAVKGKNEKADLSMVELARKAVGVIEDKRGSDIILLDIRSVSLIADFFVICTGESERQIRAISEGVQEELKEIETSPLSVEGTAPSGWMILDYGGIVVHIFAAEERNYYRLERLWKDAQLVVRIQ